jgi:hypothetical protein
MTTMATARIPRAWTPSGVCFARIPTCGARRCGLFSREWFEAFSGSSDFSGQTSRNARPSEMPTRVCQSPPARGLVGRVLGSVLLLVLEGWASQGT